MITISTAGDHEMSALGLMRAAALALPGLHARSRARHGRGRRRGLRDARVVADLRRRPGRHERGQEPRTPPAGRPPRRWRRGTTRRRCCRGSGRGSRAGCGWALRRGGSPVRTGTCCAPTSGCDPGDKITLGFDGSRTGDATALVACRVEDGLVQLLDCWEAPDRCARVGGSGRCRGRGAGRRDGDLPGGARLL